MRVDIKSSLIGAVVGVAVTLGVMNIPSAFSSSDPLKRCWSWDAFSVTELGEDLVFFPCIGPNYVDAKAAWLKQHPHRKIVYTWSAESDGRVVGWTHQFADTQ